MPYSNKQLIDKAIGDGSFEDLERIISLLYCVDGFADFLDLNLEFHEFVIWAKMDGIFAHFEFVTDKFYGLIMKAHTQNGLSELKRAAHWSIALKTIALTGKPEKIAGYECSKDLARNILEVLVGLSGRNKERLLNLPFLKAAEISQKIMG